ncbi:MAG: site-2 protease family protein [Oscillospiraceae bacterium]|nr:site-2 protease family protein [Oscillospiraceae bacterium]
MYIVLAIIIFGLLITVHEVGHFVAARASGVKVSEFAVGMGPALLKKQGKETVYSLRLLPIGGFCAMEGEDDGSADPRAFCNRPLIFRVIILLGGSAMNFLFGLLLLFIIFSQAAGFSSPTIAGFMDGFPGEGESGLTVGDTIHRINGRRTYFTENVGRYLSRGNGKTADIVVIRDGKKIKLKDFPIEIREYVHNGDRVMKYGLLLGEEQNSFAATIKYSWYSSLDFTRMVWIGLSDLVSGAVGLRELAGPVGIVSVMNEVGKESPTAAVALDNIAYLSAFIAVNLAIMNLLPIPALDGGRLLLLFVTKAVELTVRRKVDPKFEGYIHMAGFVLLLGLMIVVMFNDILRIAGG